MDITAPDDRDGVPMDADTIAKAFHLVGERLADAGLMGEIAVYGGSAILLQFDWRRSTQDVDAVPLRGVSDRALADAVTAVGAELGLPRAWLNDFVGMYTPEVEHPSFFSLLGEYPAGPTPGLRVFLARPQYLCAMKLRALERETVDDRDFEDVVRLALEVEAHDGPALLSLYGSFFPDEPLPPVSAAVVPSVVQEIDRRRSAP
jgi:hypothetical protein